MRIASSHLHGKRGEKSEQNVATTPVKGTAISIDDFALQRVEEQENKPNGMRPTTSGTKEVDRERGGGARGGLKGNRKQETNTGSAGSSDKATHALCRGKRRGRNVWPGLGTHVPASKRAAATASQFGEFEKKKKKHT